ncbi:MAG: hypothetical protein AAF429_12280 [Pseudomonadota bacterium]
MSEKPSEETIRALHELALVLKPIYQRIMADPVERRKFEEMTRKRDESKAEKSREEFSS